jgi:exodeoxyribonuclease VII small subunit
MTDEPGARDLIPVEQLSYEQAFTELEDIVEKLESDQQSLEEALALYERGQSLAQHCAGLLDKAELKIQQLSGDEMTEFDQEG